MMLLSDRVLAGVSGGADSVCLALVLKELGFDLAIAHVNHGLRGADSDGDEEFTKELAAKLGVGFFSKRVSLLRPSPGAPKARHPLPGGEGLSSAALVKSNSAIAELRNNPTRIVRSVPISGIRTNPASSEPAMAPTVFTE